ncbi:hypothetical protein MMYC01_210445 [Madurella mycetomatis]|uniref:Uncharacterized protein n=1 Tax=Madurella mycetomatis TaxID=100816 RepID=A0A175VP40_9PEZI|nr:hypothetical protein MMYC01_210445 [Madurella mycetomatis]
MSEPTPTPAPAPDPAPALEATARPENWKAMDVAAKVAWLNTQPLPSDPTVSLGSCYDRGTRFNVYAYGVFQAIQLLESQVKERKDSTIWQYVQNMMAAFKQGVGSYSNAVAEDCRELLEEGKYSDRAQPLHPMTIPGTTIWDTAHNVITILTKTPSLNQPRPGLGGTSWASLFQAFIDAAQKFWEEWKKQKREEQFHDVDLTIPGFTELEYEERLPLTIPLDEF